MLFEENFDQELVELAKKREELEQTLRERKERIKELETRYKLLKEQNRELRKECERLECKNEREEKTFEKKLNNGELELFKAIPGDFNTKLEWLDFFMNELRPLFDYAVGTGQYDALESAILEALESDDCELMLSNAK